MQRDRQRGEIQHLVEASRTAESGSEQHAQEARALAVSRQNLEEEARLAVHRARIEASVAASQVEAAKPALAAEGVRGTENVEMAAAVRLSELLSEFSASQELVAAQSSEGQRLLGQCNRYQQELGEPGELLQKCTLAFKRPRLRQRLDGRQRKSELTSRERLQS